MFIYIYTCFVISDHNNHNKERVFRVSKKKYKKN